MKKKERDVCRDIIEALKTSTTKPPKKATCPIKKEISEKRSQ